MRTARIGTVAFLVEDEAHSIEQNVERGCEYIRQGSRKGCDLLLLPEMFRTINVPGMEMDAEEISGGTSAKLAEAARVNQINVAANWYVREGDRIYNQTTIFNRAGGIVGWYRKVQPTVGEARTVTPGNEFPVFDLDFGRVAVMVCLDIYFPEIPRIYAHKGVELILWPTVTLGPTQEGLRAQLISRAIDNCIYIAESNMANHPPYSPFSGRYRPGTARIVDFNGEVIASTGRLEGIACADIDFSQQRLTSYCILKREPDHFREDLEGITRLDLYAQVYAELAETQQRDADYFNTIIDNK
ncbi:MAG: carbon-nitrogen hydrolase family protein [Candidatus Kapaibacterium sp.]